MSVTSAGSLTCGSLVTPKTPDDPPGLDDGSAAAVLDQAEDIINAVGPDIVAEVERDAHRSRWPRLRRRRKTR